MVATLKRGAPRFPLGRIIATKKALAALNDSGEIPSSFIDRHVSGDRKETRRSTMPMSRPGAG